VVRVILIGWSISPIVTIHSGLPFTILDGKDANLDGSSSTDRATFIGDPTIGSCTNGAQVGSTACWFNNSSTVIQLNPATNGKFVDGTSARNALTGPGYKDLDLAFFRDLRIRERYNAQFRVESTNLFNHPNLGTPVNTVGSAGFGTITTANAMRQLQFGVRLTF